MQFEGLKGLLKKKKTAAAPASSAQPATTATSTAPSTTLSSAASAAVGHVTDPYATALAKARQQQLQQQPPPSEAVPSDTLSDKSRKRSRETSVGGEEARPTGPSTTPEAPPETSTAAELHRLTNEKKFRSAEEIAEERRRGSVALHRCRVKMEFYWAKGRAGAHATSTPSTASSAPSECYPCASPLPDVVGTYVLTQFVRESRHSPATGEPEMALLDRELALLADLYTAEMTEDAVVPSEAATEEAAGQSSDARADALQQQQPPTAVNAGQHVKLGETLRVLWYLIALRWQYSLDPTLQATTATKVNAKTAAAATSTPGLPSDQHGWSPYVYLALQGALPADVRLTLGREVAQQVDQWRALTRTRQFALELLAYLYSDYQALKASLADGSSGSAACIVPSALRDTLHEMLVQHLQHDRNFMAARQDYVDVTMGTANWKLGLFSGGEVHMRRSMERVERNRIHHLLNNEHATHMLQSVRELTTFVEAQKSSLLGFFCFGA